jgi:gamma-glutamyl:cysteine ligase YbdK (ATP-grasp superfamily)
MAQAIAHDHFSSADTARFLSRLDTQLHRLREVVAQPGFGVGPTTLGAELELAIIDGFGAPCPLNRAVLAAVDDPRLTFEIDRFNLEYNLAPVPAAGRPFTAMQREIEHALTAIDTRARAHDAHVTTIGILPSITMADLDGRNLTDLPRYRALADGLKRLRPEPLTVHLSGKEPLVFSCDHIAIEGANTSFQVHLRVCPGLYAAHYNAAQLATAITLAVSGNSPTFLGHLLWEETRIALFKKVMEVRTADELAWHRPARVAFGHGWLRHGIAELFAEAVAFFPPLLPVVSDHPEPDHGAPRLAELRTHAGTVWRWNRGIYDPADGGHLRIEMRTLPAGPTPIDMMANAALQLGLTVGLATQHDPPIEELLDTIPFGIAETNFYRAARDGLDAAILWPAARLAAPSEHTVPRLIDQLLPVAARGLDALGVDAIESRRLLTIIEHRVASGQTGAQWQRRTLSAFEASGLSRSSALLHLTGEYVKRSKSGAPVHQWDIPR